VKLHASTSGAGIQEVEWLNNSQAVGADVGSAMVFTGTSSNNGLARISGAFAGATTADGAYMAFSTRAVTTGTLAEKMRLDSSGNLLVGATSNAAGARLLSENATGNQLGLRYTSVATWYNSIDSSGNYIWTKDGTNIARFDSSGNLLVGTTSSGGGKVYVQGGASQSAILGTTDTLNYAGIQGAHTVNASNAFVAYFANSGSTTGLYISNTAAWQSTSDERLKTDIQDLDSTQRLMQLRPRDYLWKSQETSDDPTKRNLGFIAQEVKDIFPELVGVSPDGMFSVEYTGLIAPLVKAIQEQQAIITQLTARITALEGA
jgi:hypothetical protein